MPNPNALYEDILKINTLYDELCWGHDDELEFSIEFVKGNGRVIIRNKTLEEKQ